MTTARSGLVAVLFTDLVGSTKLMSRLGERGFDEVRRDHFSSLSKVVTAHGGEEIKNTGDGILAVFPSAAEAVEAAVAMQQATVRRCGEVRLAMRVGVAAGDATLERGDVFGAPVVEAARLVAEAEPGQVLATSGVGVLAGSRSTARFTEVGPLRLKGLAEPMPVCQVAWEAPAGSSIPLPALLTEMGRVFVGRNAEMERLGQLWKEAAAGERPVALLTGEPGVGKTRLAAQLAGEVHEEGGVVLAGRWDEDLGVPYQPFVEALRHFVDHTPVEELRGRLGRYGGELARLVPELADQGVDLPPPLKSDPETERYRLFDAVAAWLVAASAEAPLLLVLDDLHWAAKPTLLLLRHVVRSADPKRVFVVGIYRDTELGHHPLVEVLADLRRQGGVERLSLAGLDHLGVVVFMEQAAGHDLDDNELLLARAIYEETEGNPFFVKEVLRHLAETAAIERHEGRWVARRPIEEVGIPEGVREVVGKRLSRLPAEANRLLRIGAVVGSEFEAGRRTGQPDVEVFWVLHLFGVRFEQGRLAEIEAEVAGFAARHPLHMFRAMLALLYCETGQGALARERYEDVACELEDIRMDMAWIGLMADLATACAYVADAPRAERLSRLLAPYANQFVTGGGALSGSVSYYLGLLATALERFDEADRALIAATAVHDRIGAPTWLARTRLAWARMLLTRRRPGDEERARELLGQALTAARELGLAKVELDAASLL